MEEPSWCSSIVFYSPQIFLSNTTQKYHYFVTKSCFGMTYVPSLVRVAYDFFVTSVQMKIPFELYYVDVWQSVN